MTKYRTEEDTLGPVQIPADALWGPQTERSRNNFPVYAISHYSCFIEH